MRKKLFTVILPCLNEETTILKRINKIEKSLEKSKYKNAYEILVCDNDSEDKSTSILKKHKIKFLIEKKRGYGNALNAGFKAATTKYVVMLDSDLSYNSDDIPRFVGELDNGNDFVIGNRFRGQIEKGAMSLSHKIGSRLLTEYANLLFRTKMHDFHCGLRAFNREKINSLNLDSTGFEFASEMIIKAKLEKLKMKEVETDLKKDGRKRKSHLRTFRDGFRHLHEINKTKFKTSKIFRYFSTFTASILVVFAFTFSSCLIPHNLVHDNVITSAKQLHQKFLGNRDKNNLEINKFEEYGDVRNYAMAFATDNNNPFESAILMNYNRQCDAIDVCSTALENNIGNTVSYGRYWQGQSSTIHFFTILFDVNTLTIISTIIFSGLFVFTLYKLFKKDKILSVIYLLSAISVNLPFTTRSLEFIPVMYIMVIGTLLVVHMREKNSKYFDILFLLLGVFTCYFDFLTAETITVTVPLFIYTYLDIKEHKKASIKKIICYSILWFIGYAGAYLVKWGLIYLLQGEHGVRVAIFNIVKHKTTQGFFVSAMMSIGKNLSLLIPFFFLTDGLVLCIFITIICLIYNIAVQKENLPLYLICAIPFLRFALIAGHSYPLSFFTYRALFCFVMLTLLTIFKMMHKTLAK